ncbi:MAG TPA: hypothetical protein VGD77_11065 [Gemmatimonadaceae bacterium]
MKARLLLAGAMTFVAAQAAEAQTACPAGAGNATTLAQAQANAKASVCQMAHDIFQLMGPQLGAGLVGGNPLIGSGGTLGGFPHLAVALRGTVFNGDLPDFDGSYDPSFASSPSRRTLTTKSQVVGLPGVDAALGIFKGIPLGVTNVGGVDLLANAVYVPEVTSDGEGVTVSPETNLKIGYGVRVGLLQESILVPGVSVSWVKRDVPTTTIVGTSTDLDVRLQDLAVKSTAIRAVASKSFLVFGLAVGAGQDKYDQEVVASGTAKGLNFGGVSAGDVATGPHTFTQSLTRTNIFANLSLNLPILKLVGEVGQVSGGDIATYNDFTGGDPAKSRTYGSAGIRIQF